MPTDSNYGATWHVDKIFTLIDFIIHLIWTHISQVKWFGAMHIRWQWWCHMTHKILYIDRLHTTMYFKHQMPHVVHTSTWHHLLHVEISIGSQMLWSTSISKHGCWKLHQIWYLMSRTIYNYMVLYLSIFGVMFYQVKLLMFYNVHTTNLIFAGKVWDIQLIDIALCYCK